MPRDVLDPRIFQKIMSSPRIGQMREQSVRDAISRIHIDNHGITMNAAAAEFARKKGIRVNRYLTPEDRASFQNLKSPSIPTAPSAQGRKKGISVPKAKPDFGSEFTGEANHNAEIYPYIYILENTLRDVILKEFGSGQEWWIDGTTVSTDIQEYAEKIRQAEQKYPWIMDRGNHSINYVGLLELFKIIEKNWKGHFSKVLKDLEQLRAWIKESVPIRNLVAHNIKTREQERQVIRKNTDYICRIVQKSKS